MTSSVSISNYNDEDLIFPITIDIQKNLVKLVLEDSSYLRLDHHKRSLERNVLSSYGIDTNGPVFFFSGLQSNNTGKGQATFLMDCASTILDQSGYWVLNEVRPSHFSKEGLERLIKFYEKYNYRLLQKGRDAALMYRKPNLL